MLGHDNTMRGAEVLGDTVGFARTIYVTWILCRIGSAIE